MPPCAEPGSARTDDHHVVDAPERVGPAARHEREVHARDAAVDHVHDREVAEDQQHQQHAGDAHEHPRVELEVAAAPRLAPLAGPRAGERARRGLDAHPYSPRRTLAPIAITGGTASATNRTACT